MSYASISHSNPVRAVEEISLDRPNNSSTAQPLSVQRKGKCNSAGIKIDPMQDNYTKYLEYMRENPDTPSGSCYHPLQPPVEGVTPLEELPVKELTGRTFPQSKRHWRFQTDKEIYAFDAFHFKVFLAWLLVFALYYYFR